MLDMIFTIHVTPGLVFTVGFVLLYVAVLVLGLGVLIYEAITSRKGIQD